MFINIIRLSTVPALPVKRVSDVHICCNSGWNLTGNSEPHKCSMNCETDQTNIFAMNITNRKPRFQFNIRLTLINAVKPINTLSSMHERAPTLTTTRTHTHNSASPFHPQILQWSAVGRHKLLYILFNNFPLWLQCCAVCPAWSMPKWKFSSAHVWHMLSQAAMWQWSVTWRWITQRTLSVWS